MIYKAQVTRLNKEVEEDVDLLIQGVELNCFASICPYRLEPNKIYPIELELIVLDEYRVVELTGIDKPNFIKTGKGFAYEIRGRIVNSYFDAGGLLFKDDVLATEFGYLKGKMVSLTVDRIGVAFL
ncbi:hypothetical protein ACFX58_15040 [Sphingomonas sp. NCPPB 2930]